MAHSAFFDSDSGNRFELAGAKPNYVPDRPGQVEHIFLDLVLDIPNQRCEGVCQIKLRPVRQGIKTIELDAVDMEIRGVKVGKQKQRFTYDGDRLTVHLRNATKANRVLTLTIDYTLDQPQRGLYFIAPNKHYPNKPTQVWTQGEDEDSRFWFPCFDYPGQLSTSEVKIRVPESYTAISNGKLLDTTLDGNEIIYHWYQPQVHPTYLMTIAVGEFVEIQDGWEKNGETIPVTYYVDPSREDDALLSMGKTPRMIEFFSQYYGYDYPYPKYAQVCVDDFIFGGMENTSTTLLTDRCLIDERAALDNRSAEMLVAHELAHQWFGDLVVIRHWSHAWIKEGMASYSEVMWSDHEYSADDAAYYRLKEARSYLNEDKSRYRRPVVTHVYREAIELYDRHLYEKGCCIYHMIRHELGEDLFWKAIHTFVQDNAHRTVETVDLLRAIEKATGRNLLFLFDQYVFRGGHPDYSVDYRWDEAQRYAKVTVKQTQVDKKATSFAKGLFDLNIDLGFGYSNGSDFKSMETITVHIHEEQQTFYIPLAEKPSFISFDVGNHYLKTVKLNYGLAELSAQLKHDPDPVSRIYAAIALAKKGGLKALEVLEGSLVDDPFWGVRAEVASQLPKLKLDQSLVALKRGLKDADPRVRRAVVSAIATLRNPDSYKLLKSIAEKGDPSYYVEAAAVTGIGTLAASSTIDKPKESKAIKLMQSVLKERAGWNEVVRGGAIAGLSKMKHSADALDILLKYSQLGTPQQLRLAAIRGLGSVAGGQTEADLDRIHDRLASLATESFFLTQVAVVNALGQLKTSRALGILRSLSQQTPDGRVRRRADEAIGRVQKSIKKDEISQEMKDSVEELKRTNQKLVSRVEELEAKLKQLSQ
ncbi:MAG: M1 family metallopeptidase [Cyanobacteria bacterium P01_F01_bin.42]